MRQRSPFFKFRPIYPSSAAFGNPKGNADTERAIRTMKEELPWLREWEDEHEAAQEAGRWVERFNEILSNVVDGRMIRRRPSAVFD
jgi:hypothetical protein